MNTHYRGFDITLVASNPWTAEISRSSSGRRWSRTPTASAEEGREVCLRRAMNLVDAFIALKGR